MRVSVWLLFFTLACKEAAIIRQAVIILSRNLFRGGTVSWRHLTSNGFRHQIEVSFRLGWRNSHSPPYCDNWSIINRTLGRYHGYWKIIGKSVSSSDFPHSVATICTAFDSVEDWAYGYNTFTATVSSSQTFGIQFQGGNWINSLYFGRNSNWTLATEVDFRLRSDTRRVNSPPVAFSPPVVRLISGCPSTIKIVSYDADDDVVRCRYAVGEQECGGVCGSYHYFTLNKQSCTIHYNGGGVRGWNYLVPVALMLEDHPRQNITIGESRNISTSDPISATPLQFLVKIPANQTNVICNALPSYPIDTVAEGAYFIISSSGWFHRKLKARPGHSGGRIKRFMVFGPVGMATDGVRDEGNDVFSTNLAWTPYDDQRGVHDVCFYAIDGNEIKGEQRCFTVRVTQESLDPCEFDNGGCSDICTKTNTSHVCSCSHSCWELSSDRKTCVPKMKVECTGEDITIIILGCSTDKTVIANQNLSMENCHSTKRNSDHYLFFGSQECGLKMEVGPVTVEYSINVWIWKEEEPGFKPSVITRGQWGRIPVTCSLPSSNMVHGSFVPVLPFNNEFVSEEVSIDGMGRFTLYFEYYRNRGFSNEFPLSEYPIQVRVSDEIFFSIGAIGRSGLELFTEECAAATSRVYTPSTVAYKFIKDGCLIDNKIIRYKSSSPMENRFSLEAFQFDHKLLLDRSRSEIFLQCRVIICDSTRNDSRRSKGCISRNRHRRDTHNDFEDADDDSSHFKIAESPPQIISSRFVLVLDASEGGASGRTTSIDFTNWILLSVGVLILSIAIFIAVYVVKSKRLSH